MKDSSSISNPFAIPRSILMRKLSVFLDEDLHNGDLSSGFIPADVQSKAKIFSKTPGIVAGLQEAQLLFEENGLLVQPYSKDGDSIPKNHIIMEIEGNLRNILMIERTALNFLMRLSSVATSTADYVSLIHQVSTHTKLAATRKVTPGFGWFEKKAVYYGGGDPHRWNLSDMVMFKDTHRAYFQNDIALLLQTAKKQVSFSKKIELEIEKVTDLPIAIQNGADIIMFDNLTPEEIEKAIKSIENRPPNIIFEASGNVTLENVKDYALSGVDIISTSAPIFRPHRLIDYSLRLM